MMTKKWIFNTVNIFFVYGMHKHAFKINSSLLGMAGGVDVVDSAVDSDDVVRTVLPSIYYIQCHSYYQ